MPVTISEIRTDELTFNHLIHKNPSDSRNMFAKHVHDRFEIILFINGDATYIIEDKRYKLKPFDLVLIPPSKYHYIQIDSDADYDRFDLLFPTEVVGVRPLSSLPDQTDVISCATNKSVREIFNKMDRYAKLGEDVIIDLIPGFLKEIFYNVSESLKDSVSKPENTSPVISKALDYINNNLYTIKNIEEISGELFIAPTYFFRIFKEQMKISPKKYITVKRLIEAKKRIKNGEKPTEIFSECGFATYTAFYKRYVEYFGSPPSKTN